MKLENKTIVLTGGTSGVGYQLLKWLSPKNKVIVISRPSKRLDELLTLFERVEVYPADLSNPSVYEGLVDGIIKDHNRVDVLINNAAVQNTPTFLDDDFNYDGVKPEIHLNFTSICSLSYLFLPAMLDDHLPAVIANINSGLALAPKTNSAIYCASKAGMNTFSQSLAYQLEHTNIQVVQPFLPLVDTPMTAGRGKGKMPPEVAALEIIKAIEQGSSVRDIGKVKILRLLMTLAPWLARRIMKGM